MLPLSIHLFDPMAVKNIRIQITIISIASAIMQILQQYTTIIIVQNCRHSAVACRKGYWPINCAPLHDIYNFQRRNQKICRNMAWNLKVTTAVEDIDRNAPTNIPSDDLPPHNCRKIAEYHKFTSAKAKR